MRSMRFALAAAALIASTAMTAVASPTAPANGVDYITLAAPQPVQTVGKKIEVIEFFAFHCGACNVFEPTLHAWVQKNADKVSFRRIPFPFTGPADPEAHLYLTLEAMGKAEEYTGKVFRAFHVERQRLTKDDVILDWAAKNGLDMVKFKAAWNSFGVLTKLKRLPTVASNYKIDSTPSVVVNGRYLTSPGVVGEGNKNLAYNQTAQAVTLVLDHLVATARKEKGIAK